MVYDFTWRDHSRPQASQKLAQPATADLSSAQTPVTEHAQHAQHAQQAQHAQHVQSVYPIAAMAHNIPRAVSALQQGQVIALPTDTLYGLAADANSSAGIQHIYSIKQRQAQTPLAICIAEVADLQRYCVTDHLSQDLLEQLLPGKVTLILERRADAPLCQELNPGLSSIGRLDFVQ